jgi:hypothetical protein
MRTQSRLTRGLAAGIVLAALAATVAACGDDGGGGTSTGGGGGATTTAEPVIDPGDNGNYHPQIDPADFVRGVDNPYYPLPPGARWVYAAVEDGEHERDEVTVTDEQRQVMGIPVVVVHDQVSVGGEVTEDTRDWFAQDRDGNVWYMGEDTAEYENGSVKSREGSWEAGVDGAQPGIVMPAHPQVGRAYRQEFYEGHAEDMGEILRLDGTASVPAGDYDRVVVTREWNPLEPDVIEQKYYARGVGVVLENTTHGGQERVELATYDPGEG